MPASVVRSPVPVTATRSEPDWFTVPAITLSPTFFSTGRDSPVIMDSLTLLWPSRTSPSAGTLAPGRIRTRSPSARAAIATSSTRSSDPSRTTRTAVFGSSLASSARAPCAWLIERISIQWPSSMMVTSVASSSQSGIPG